MSDLQDMTPQEENLFSLYDTAKITREQFLSGLRLLGCSDERRLGASGVDVEQSAIKTSGHELSELILRRIDAHVSLDSGNWPEMKNEIVELIEGPAGEQDDPVCITCGKTKGAGEHSDDYFKMHTFRPAEIRKHIAQPAAPVPTCIKHPFGRLPEGRGLWEVPHGGCDYPSGGCNCYCGINCQPAPPEAEQEESNG